MILYLCLEVGRFEVWPSPNFQRKPVASSDLLIKTAESVSHTSVAVKSALDCGFITTSFFTVSVHPLDEVKAKLIFFVPARVNKYDGFSRYDGLSLLKFQWNVVVIGLLGFVPVN